MLLGTINKGKYLHVVILTILFLFYPIFSFAKEISYPTNQVERPLALPDGIWEIGAGISFLQWEDGSNSSWYPILSLRYGITDNIELYLAGLKYRILRNAPIEIAIKGGIVGFGHSSIDGTFLLTEVGVEGKQRVHPMFAILYRIENYYGYLEKTKNTNDIRISLGGLLAFTEKLALELCGTYRRLDGFNTLDAVLFTTSFYYNISSAFDILINGEFSDFSENEHLRYLSKSFRHAYGIRLNWRF